MPTEDPRRDGPRRDGLRIGGWLETFPRRRPLAGRPPLVTPPPTRVPVFQPVRPPTTQRRPIARAATRFAGIEDPRQVRLRVAVTFLVVTAVGTVGFLALTDRSGTVAVAQQASVADPVTLGPMPPASASPALAGLPASIPPVTRLPGGTAAGGTRPVGAGPTSAAPVRQQGTGVVRHSPSPSTRPLGGLRVGETASLAVTGSSGLRVRHRNFVGRVDRIGPTSSPLDHADSAFVVRGTATSGCVAFESVNYPGYFLRHQNFAIHLDRTDRSSQFQLDSSFCPVVAGDGSFRLRSANYPDRYLATYGASLYLAQVPVTAATAFTAAAPY